MYNVYGTQLTNMHKRTRHNSKQKWYDHLIKWLLLSSMNSLSVNLKIVISRYEHIIN